MANESVLRETVAEHIDLITINRPDARNAVNSDVALGIAEAVEATENDPEVWVVVLTGAGDKAFCAGADLKAIARGGFDNLATDRGGFAGFIKQPRTKPWIAAVKGFALAGVAPMMYGVLNSNVTWRSSSDTTPSRSSARPSARWTRLRSGAWC